MYRLHGAGDGTLLLPPLLSLRFSLNFRHFSLTLSNAAISLRDWEMLECISLSFCI